MKTDSENITRQTKVTLLSKFEINEGDLLVYLDKKFFTLNALVIDKNDKNKVLWKSTRPFWRGNSNIKLNQIDIDKRRISISYGEKSSEKITKYFDLDELFGITKKPSPILFDKVSQNPILKPNNQNNWESSAVFNPAALYLDDRVHFLYRAVGTAGISMLGYASSQDGIHIDERLTEPVFAGPHPTHKPDKNSLPFHYQSGISWGGCEDPRLTKIGDTIYMTYTAFDAWHPPGVAMTSISVSDFLAKKWRWTPPMMLSPYGEMHKNWVIFPEKINDKYAILHSVTPEILIGYVDNLDTQKDLNIKSNYYSNDQMIRWDSWVRGVGAPPIKTTEGWLILYHGMDHRDPNKYKIGAMILDQKNPENILYRSLYPLLEPDRHYENEGYKSGVVYNCGAVLIDEKLLIYYGGADTVVCVAVANINTLINELKTSKNTFIQNTSIVEK